MTVHNLEFKDGDGDEYDFSPTDITIKTVTNGWILETISEEEEEELTEVYNFEQASQLIEAIKRALGAPGA
jgi:hypothetical protein